MGSGPSSLEPELALALPHTAERFIGLRNYGNVCFANAVIQLLYRCEPLRSHLIQWHMCVRDEEAKSSSSSWFGFAGWNRSSSSLELLGELFHRLQNNGERTGTTGADDLMGFIKRRNELFDSRQQDAQEFFSFLVNDLAEAVQKEQLRAREDAGKSLDPFRAVVCRVFEESIGKTFVHGLLFFVVVFFPSCNDFIRLCVQGLSKECARRRRRAEPAEERARAPSRFSRCHWRLGTSAVVWPSVCVVFPRRKYWKRPMGFIVSLQLAPSLVCSPPRSG